MKDRLKRKSDETVQVLRELSKKAREHREACENVEASLTKIPKFLCSVHANRPNFHFDQFDSRGKERKPQKCRQVISVEVDMLPRHWGAPKNTEMPHVIIIQIFHEMSCLSPIQNMKEKRVD
jgi:hypothetical protein